MKGGLTCSSEGMIPKFQGLSGFLSQTNYQVPLDANHSPVQYSLRADKPPFSILRDNVSLGKGFNSFMAGETNGLKLAHPYKEQLGEDTDDIAPWLVDFGDGLGHERLVWQDLLGVMEEAKSSGALPKIIEATPHDFFTS
ncbi:hypothetical protein LB504_009348 [Fusarium proliferatum]|nr:hypothetical protein LB504_009348 [Fusarium proliferatum]